MVKPLQEFGGWLKFFYITCWVNLIIIAMSAVLSLIAVLKSVGGVYSINPLCILLRSLVVGFLFVWMTLIVRNKHSGTPQALRQVMNLYLWISLIVAMAVGGVDYFLLARPWFDVLVYSIGTIIVVSVWWSIWTLYFMSSRRVLAYYGSNA